MVSFSLSPCLLVSLSLFLAPAPGKPTPEQIARWVQDLGDNDFNTRENASRLLWEAGQLAEKAVKEATKSTDLEVSRRAQEILEKFRWGIFPDTPKKVIDLVHRYQLSDAKGRLEALRELFEHGGAGCTALARIVQAETNPQLRQQLLAQIGQEIPRALPSLIAEGRLDVLEGLLEGSIAIKPEALLPAYTSFLLLHGRLDDRIAQLKAAPGTTHNQEILLRLYRARGDLASTGPWPKN